MVKNNTNKNQKNIWEIVMGYCTIIGLFLTAYTIYQNYKAVEKSNKLNEYNIYNDISKRLTTGKASEIIAACGNNTITIDSTESESNFSSVEITTLVLDLYEDVAKLEDKELISEESVDYAFSNQMLQVGSNKIIVNFIDKLRTDYKDRSLYKGFQQEFEKIYSNLDLETKKLWDTAFVKLQ